MHLLIRGNKNELEDGMLTTCTYDVASIELDWLVYL